MGPALLGQGVESFRSGAARQYRECESYRSVDLIADFIADTAAGDVIVAQGSGCLLGKFGTVAARMRGILQELDRRRGVADHETPFGRGGDDIGRLFAGRGGDWRGQVNFGAFTRIPRRIGWQAGESTRLKSTQQ